MPDQLLARDVMRIGVPTCKPDDPITYLAAQMIDHGWTALVVMDDEGDARGWLNVRPLRGDCRLLKSSPNTSHTARLISSSWIARSVDRKTSTSAV